MPDLPPFLLYGFLLASAYGFAFHAVFGKGWWQLASFWVVAVLAFGLGQWLAMLLGINIMPFGQLNVLEASVMCFIGLFATRALWQIRSNTPAVKS